MKFLPHRPGRSLLALGALVATTAVLLTACSSGGGPAPSGSDTPTTGGAITVGITGDPQPSFILAGRLGNQPWGTNVFETLTSYDENSVPQPLLATDWTVADDGLSIDIHLRDDVTFHSGRKLTADDVKFSYEQAVDPANGSQVAFIGKQFKSIDVVSDTELKITFANKLANVFDFFEQTFIVDKDTFAGLQDGSQVIGTGPYKWDSWDPGSGYKLVRNDDYWGDPPYLDEIDVAEINDSTAMVNAIRSGRVQFAFGLSGIDVKSFQDDPQYKVDEYPGSFYPLGMEVTTAPFDDVKVRQAVNYAIDRQRIVDQVFGGLASATTQYWDPQTPGYDSGLDDAYAYDPDKAKQMLDEAGATGASFEINVIDLPPNVSAAEIVRNNLEAVGLKPKVTVVETTTFGPMQNNSELGAMWMALHGSNGYGPATLISTLPALRDNNPSHFDSPEYQQLRDAVVGAADADAAAATTALAKYIVEQAFSLPLVYAPGEVVTSSDLQGVDISRRGFAYFGAAYLAH